MSKKFHTITLGCKVNQFESAAFVSELEELGHQQVSASTDADIIIINTCAVTAKGGSQSRNAVRKCARENSDASIVITGCYSQLDSELLNDIDELQGRKVLFVGNDEKEFLVSRALSDSYQNKLPQLEDMRKIRTFGNLQVNAFANRTRAYLKVQDGCNSFCSYCIVPYTRGRSRSLPMEEVISQAERFIKNGHKEIVLTGIHVGNYGTDLQESETIVSLIEKLCSLFPDTRIRLSSIEPMEIDNKLLSLFSRHDNFQSHLHIPLQGGDDDILDRMGRKYTTAEFRSIINACHEIKPDMCIGIDVLAGFPGEDEASFERTRNFLQELDYTYLHVFPYSIRPGTPAARFKNQVPKHIKDERVEVLREISEAKKKDFCLKHIDEIRPVLIEGSRDKKGRLKGFTDNYIPVLIAGENQLIHTVQQVRLVKWESNSIVGEICRYDR